MIVVEIFSFFSSLFSVASSSPNRPHLMSVLPEEDLVDVLDLSPHEPHDFHEKEKVSSLDDDSLDIEESISSSSDASSSSPEHEEEELSMVVKLGYGCAEMGLYAISSLQGFYEIKFLLEVAGLSAFVAGLIMMLGEV